MELKPGYKQTEVGVIPEDWDPKNIGGFVTLKRGHDLTWRDRRDGDIPIMGSAGPNGFHDTALAKGPGVVLGRSGASFGQAHYCELDFWPHNTALYVTDFKGNDPLFVYYLFSLIDFSSHNSGGAQQSLNRNFIAPIGIGVPSPEEQGRLAKALSDVDELIKTLEELISKKRNIKQAAMQELLTGKRRLPGFEGEWDEAQLGDIAAIRNAKAVASSMPAETQCIELECIEQGSGRLLMSNHPTGESTKYTFKKGDVLFGRLRAYLRKFWLASFDGVCSTEIWPLIARDERLSAGFLHLLVQTNDFIDAACISYGTHMPRSDWAVLRKFQLKLPPRPEQDAIATVMADIDAELSDLVQRSQKAACLKQGMVQQLLTGKIRLT
jgi:type I restriction enzyme S subunit